MMYPMTRTAGSEAAVEGDKEIDVAHTPSSVPPEVPTQDPSWSLQDPAGDTPRPEVTFNPFQHCCSTWGY